jgi:hypothetical protein
LKDVADHLKAHVAGEQIALDNAALLELNDVANIQKIYKIANLKKPKESSAAIVNGIAPSPNQVQELERIIIGMMTIKGS